MRFSCSECGAVRRSIKGVYWHLRKDDGVGHVGVHRAGAAVTTAACKGGFNRGHSDELYDLYSMSSPGEKRRIQAD